MENIIALMVKLLSLTTMFSLGLAANNQALRKNLRCVAFLIPIAFSYIVLPLITIVLLNLIDGLKSFEAMGLIIASASAGGASAGVFVRMSRGEENYAGSLIIIKSLISSMYLPVLLGFYIHNIESSVIYHLLFITLIYQLIPFAAGFFFRNKLSAMSSVLVKFNSALLFLLIFGFFIQSSNIILQISQEALAVITIVNVISFFGLNLLSKKYSFITSASYVVGVKNLTLILLVMSTLSSSLEAQIPILVYGLLMYITAGLKLLFDSKK